MKLLQRGTKALLAQAKRASFLFELANKCSERNSARHVQLVAFTITLFDKR